MTKYVQCVFFLLLFSAARSQPCSDACVDKFTIDADRKACGDGCALAVVLSVDNAREKVPDLCSAQCKQWFEGDALHACSFACHHPSDMTNSKVVVSEDESAFDVLRNQMNTMSSRILRAFPKLGEDMRPIMGDVYREAFFNTITGMHRNMDEDMQRIMQWGNHLINSVKSRPDSQSGHVLFRSRPQGHVIAAFQGPRVGNEGVYGSVIEIEPVLVKQSGELTYEKPASAEWCWSQLASRARRLSVVSQWLVCAAVVLCLVSMLFIFGAILKQIRAQRYHTSPLVYAPADKKSPPSSDYPLIHDTPPPAYDQPSIHKKAPST